MALRASRKASAWQPCADRTMAVLVLAALSYRRTQGKEQTSCNFSHAAILARHIVRNLASLSYHHLSPNTQMQPRKRRAGGSDTDTTQKTSVLSHALGADDGLNEREEGAPLARLNILTVAPKPVRGPVHHRPVYWDGQRPEKHMRMASDAELSALHTHVEMQDRLTALKDHADKLKNELGANHKQTMAAREKFGQLQGTLKTMRRAAERQRQLEQLKQSPANLLHEIVHAGAAREQIWMGVPRFTKWQRGEFLPP